MITLNGVEISKFGVTILDGTKEELKKYPAMKQGIRVENRNIHGVMSNPKYRKFEARTFYIKLRLKADSEDEYNVKYERLLQEVVRGKNGTGVNELYVSPYTYKIEYIRSDSIRYFSEKDCEIMITFEETNPNDRYKI